MCCGNESECFVCGTLSLECVISLSNVLMVGGRVRVWIHCASLDQSPQRPLRHATAYGGRLGTQGRVERYQNPRHGSLCLVLDRPETFTCALRPQHSAPRPQARQAMRVRVRLSSTMGPPSRQARHARHEGSPALSQRAAAVKATHHSQHPAPALRRKQSQQGSILPLHLLPALISPTHTIPFHNTLSLLLFDIACSYSHQQQSHSPSLLSPSSSFSFPISYLLTSHAHSTPPRRAQVGDQA